MKLKHRVLIVGIFLIGTVSSSLAADEALRIVVHLSNPTQEVSRRFLSNVFLKKITFWENGEPIIPVDLAGNSDIREEFSSQVLNKPVTAVRNYWQQMIFSGQAVQPVELESEEQAIRYVASHKNAVAYVSGAAALSSKVKAVSWR